MSDKYLDKEQFIFLPKSWGLPIPNPVLHDHKKTLDRYRIGVNINDNLVPRFFPSGRKRANQMSSSTNYTYSPKTFNRCQGEIHIVQDSMSDSEGNEK